MSTDTQGFGQTPLQDAAKTYRKLQINYTRNKAQDHTALLDQAAVDFRYEDCRDVPWNPEEFSLLYGTPLWDGATERQRVLLNQLYWVAYYSQIVSAEVATIYFNQTSAAGLYGMEDFRLVCDTLDLESSQERAHIATFKRVSDAVEQELFGERLFTWAMRGPYAPTMVHGDLGPFQRFWRGLQLRAGALLTSGNAFIASQYLTVRGVRTLNGKMVQHTLSRFHSAREDQESSPIPSKISFFHFMDESFHFNSSTLIGLEVVRCLPRPSAFERHVANLTLRGCQQDHANPCLTVRGIFWDDAQVLGLIRRLLRSPVFGMDEAEAREMLRRCYTEESEGLHQAFELHRVARESYRKYVEPLDHLTNENREMSIMGRATVDGWLARNRAALERLT